MESHKYECKFRKVNCPEIFCYEKIIFSEVLKHMENQHKFQKIEKYSETTRKQDLAISKDGFYFTHWPWMMVEPILLKFGEKNFFSFVFRDDKIKMWKFFTYMIGSRKEAEGFKSVISISDQKLENIQSTLKVSSIDVPKENILKNADLNIPDQRMYMLLKNGPIRYSVKIMKN